MKSFVLTFFLLLTIQMFAQVRQIFVKADLVKMGCSKSMDNEFLLTYRITNISQQKIIQGDTIKVYSACYSNTYLLENYYILKDTLLPDSSLTLNRRGYFDENGCFKYLIIYDNYFSNFILCGTGFYMGRIDSIKRSPKVMTNCILQIPVSYFENIKPLKSLNVIHYPLFASLSFEYYSRSVHMMDWKITNSIGRIVLRGIMELQPGYQTYSIETEGLSPGRFTLSVGNASDQESETFTILR